MLHITCLAHSSHRVCEYVRSHFKDVDTLISLGKKVFLKSNARIRIFRNNAANIPLPPSPVLTRWGTWLQAAVYYHDNLHTIKEVNIKIGLSILRLN